MSGGIDFNDATEQGTTAPQYYDRAELLAALRPTAHLWVRDIFPYGKIDDGKLRVADISGRAPRKQGSCVIDLDGEHAGSYKDFTGGRGNDAVGTIADHFQLSGLDALKKAFEIAAQYGGRVNGYTLFKGSHSGRVNGHAVEMKSSRKDYTSDINFTLKRCVPAAGTPLESYFSSRRLQLPATEDVLFHPDLTHYKTRRGYLGMVCRPRFPDGVFTGGIHRTYLADDGSGKASMAEPKMMLGPCEYGVIMLAPIGPEGALGIGEGVESTAAGMQLFNVPGWATLSAGGVRKFGAWLTANPGALDIKRLLIFADKGDDGESAGVDLRNCATSVGITTEMYLPRGGDDIADDLIKGLVPELVAADFQSKPSNTAAPTRGLPIVQIGGGRLSTAIDEAERILLNRDKHIYQRGDFIVRPAPKIIPISDDRETVGMRLIPIRTAHMIERFTNFVDFQKYDARSKKWISIDCPANIAASYLERTGEWRLRVLDAIINCPTIRPDGSILDTPGYDPATRILYDPRGVEFPPIPLKPTKDQAIAALALLKALISEFPFVPEKDTPSANRSVALSGFLTAIARKALRFAPMHGFDAPAAGTGKSKLVNVTSLISSGHEAPVITLGKTEEEAEKRLGAALIAGGTLISIDNRKEPIDSDLLCMALTQEIVDVRLLGKSNFVSTFNTAVFFVNGNNLVVTGDLVRRTIIGLMDSKEEKPELREFTTEDPVLTVKRDRPKCVAAALTVLRAFHVAGRPAQARPLLGSFEDWSGLVRDALIWLDEPDPCTTMERARAADPHLAALAEVLDRWHAAFGTSDVTVKEIVDKATDFVLFSKPEPNTDLNKYSPRHEFLYPQLREALLVVADESGNINSKRLGKWLGREKGRIVNGMRIVQGLLERHWRIELPK